jgi:hypothetical protein
VRLSPLVLLTACAISCSRPPPDATPEGALRAWIELIDEPGSDPRAAYALLSKTTHAQLEKRAERTSRIEGHHVEPYDVIAHDRFALKFQPKHYATSIEGDTATIQVRGGEPDDSATMHCVKEGKVWRVSLELPELLELPHRPEN